MKHSMTLLTVFCLDDLCDEVCVFLYMVAKLLVAVLINWHSSEYSVFTLYCMEHFFFFTCCLPQPVCVHMHKCVSVCVYVCVFACVLISSLKRELSFFSRSAFQLTHTLSS